MNKFSVLLCIAILAVFGGILYVTQKDSLIKSLTSLNHVPTLPPEAATFQLISPSPQQQGQERQQTAANSQQQPALSLGPTFGVEGGMKASYSAVIKTTKGDIDVILSGQDAPNTVKNFLNKINSNFYNNLTFHRVEDWVIQGGDPKGDGTGGGLMLTEPNTLRFVAGSLGAARGGDARISNDSQFFITKTDAAWLNGQYTNFGIVTKGMDVVNKIQVGDKILRITLK